MRAAEWGTYAGAIYCFAMAIFWTFMAVLVFVNFAGESLGAAAFAALFLIGGAGCVLLGVRMLRAGLWIDADGITVRGALKTTRVPLRVAEGFYPRDLGYGGAVRTTVGVTLRRRRGRDLVVWAMRHGEFTGKAHRAKALARWQPVCDELNSLLATYPDVALQSTRARARA
jgi:hypothetical protein